MHDSRSFLQLFSRNLGGKWSEQTFQSDGRYLTDIFCHDQTICRLVLMSELLNAGWQGGQKYEEFRVVDFALCIL